jgi:hypothetical protein
MQQLFKNMIIVLAAFTFISANLTVVNAAPKTYSENEFIDAFSGKSKKVITGKLGNPFKKDTAVKPTGANAMIAKIGADEKKSKPVKVEMWYYTNLVTYAPKKTYKEVEITFVNDRAMNIAFFNNH